MPRSAQDVTAAELALLQVLWDRENASVKELKDAVYNPKFALELLTEFEASRPLLKNSTVKNSTVKNSTVKNATVQKLLERLEKKGWVSRDRGTWPHQYRAVLLRDDLILQHLQQTADKLCGGQLHPLLTLLLNSPLPTLELEELRERMEE